MSEASVIVAASAEHRREAIEAVTFMIDAVKGTAAIWKKVKLHSDTVRKQWLVATSALFKRGVVLCTLNLTHLVC